jgi:hypothetical protein
MIRGGSQAGLCLAHVEVGEESANFSGAARCVLPLAQEPEQLVKQKTATSWVCDEICRIWSFRDVLEGRQDEKVRGLLQAQ